MFVITQTPELAAKSSVKTLTFSWEAINGANSYKLLFDSEGSNAHEQIGDDLSADTLSYAQSVSMHLYPWETAQFKVQACNKAGYLDSASIRTGEHMLNTISSLAADHADSEDRFGVSAAVSADGETLVVGAPYEDGSSTGINGSDNNDIVESCVVLVLPSLESCISIDR